MKKKTKPHITTVTISEDKRRFKSGVIAGTTVSCKCSCGTSKCRILLSYVARLQEMRL